jgi:hypothetical protein
MEKTMSIKRVHGMLMGPILAAAVFAPAQADVEKVYPGTICQPDRDYMVDDLVYSDRSLYNEFPGYVYVTCPIVKDDAPSTRGIDFAYVRVYDNSSSGSFRCYWNACSSYGGSCRYDVEYSSYSGRGSRSLRLQQRSSSSYGLYSIDCRVPAYSRIYSIRVRED